MEDIWVQTVFANILFSLPPAALFIATYIVDKKLLKKELLARRINYAQYGPPESFRPAFIVFTKANVVDWGMLAGATIVDLSVKGYIHAVNEVDGISIAKSTEGSGNSAELYLYEQLLLDTIFVPDGAVLSLHRDTPLIIERLQKAKFYDQLCMSYGGEFPTRVGVVSVGKGFDSVYQLMVAIGLSVAFLLALVSLFIPALITLIAVPYAYGMYLTWKQDKNKAIPYTLRIVKGMLGAYLMFLRTTRNPIDFSDVSAWDKETGYRIVSILQHGWAEPFSHLGI